MTPSRTVCPRLHYAFELVGARWNAAVLLALGKGARRFGEIRDAVPGISDTMLADRLRTLRGERLVARVVEDTTPVVVGYELTAKGRELGPVIADLTRWAHRWYAVPDGTARPRAADVVGLDAPAC